MYATHIRCNINATVSHKAGYKQENHDAKLVQTGCWADAAKLSQDTTVVCTDRQDQLSLHLAKLLLQF